MANHVARPHAIALKRKFVGDVPSWNHERAERFLSGVSRLGVAALERAIGGLSTPSKMPCNAFNLPAISTCKVGAMLSLREGTVCFKCYATKGRYVFEETINAQERRLSTLDANPELFAASMVALLRKKKGKRSTHFRWHDSGEVRGPNHRDLLLWIGRKCPDVKFWIPTREYATWKDSAADVPTNMCVRLSAHKVGAPPPRIEGFPTSTVGWDGAPANCPAPQQEGKCGDCRRCWDRSFENVNYHVH